jgi:hypothetical protein
MKFANKYELFAAVTKGRVETFTGKVLTSGEPVLFHIFEAPEQRPDQPTVDWVVGSFRSVAPNPPGVVIDTGRYGATNYAYLVTKLVDDGALQRWIQSYESQGLETQGFEVDPDDIARLRSLTGNDVSRPDRPAERALSPNSLVDPSNNVTAEFSALTSRLNHPPESETSKKNEPGKFDFEPAPSRQRVPSDFTRQFSRGPKQVPKETAAEAPVESAIKENPPLKPETSPNRTESWEAVQEDSLQSPGQSPRGDDRALSSPRAASSDPGSFTAMFQSGSEPQTYPSSEGVHTPPLPKDNEGGRFTDFFRGPFDGERPAETPVVLPGADRRETNPPGDFTRVFGLGKGGDPGSTPASQPSRDQIKDASREAPSMGSTQIFTNTGGFPAPAPETARPKWEPTPPTSIRRTPNEPTWDHIPAQVPSEPSIPPSIQSVLTETPVSSTFRETSAPQHDGATRIFSVPSEGLAPSEPPVHSGPSEYTRVISGINTVPREEVVPSSGSPNQGGLSAFKIPAIPGMPLAPQIPVRPLPTFSPPPVAAPLAAKVPQLGGKDPKPKGSYMPLVLILGALFVFALLLIAYFAIKH